MDIDQFTDPAFVLNLTLKLFLAHQVSRNLEFFAFIKQFSQHGLLSWEISRLRNQNRATRIIQSVGIFYSNSVFLLLMAIATLASLLIIFGIAVLPTWLLFMPVIAFNFLVHYRNNLFCDGSDTMGNILSIPLAIGICNQHNQVILVSGIVFIAVQTFFSYVFAAHTKFRSEAWMKGYALSDILNTSLFGNAFAADTLKKISARTNKVLNIAVAVWQCAFPLCILLPQNYFLAYIASGVLFHLANAYFMGLVRFLLIFIATYPSLLFVKFKYLNY